MDGTTLGNSELNLVLFGLGEFGYEEGIDEIHVMILIWWLGWIHWLSN
jgi:hypothetical protein